MSCEYPRISPEPTITFKKHVWMRCLVLLAVLQVAYSGIHSASAQQGSAPAPAAIAGQVTGHVFCLDTGQPARFAGVQLFPENPGQTRPLIDPASLGKDADFASVMAKAMAAVMKGSNLATVTGIDGTFSLDKVPPGTYYVIPQLPGYRSPLSGYSLMERLKADAATVASVESAAEKVVVTGGASINVNLELERGATLSGRVAYDDGSPAPGVTPELLMQQKDGKWKELQMSSLPPVTDDRGQFRFYGLPSGKFSVKATLPVSQSVAGLGGSSVAIHMNSGDALVVYQSGVLREKDIKPIQVGDGDQVDGVEVVFPVNGLHGISGSVVAKFDNHAVNFGTIELEDADTKTPIRTAILSGDGTFQLNYVPEGSYVLKVNAADAELKNGEAPSANDFGRLLNSKTVRSYGPVEKPVTLTGDVNGLVIQVPDQKSATEPPGSLPVQ